MSNLSNSVSVNQRKLSNSSGHPVEPLPEQTTPRRGSKRDLEEDLDDDSGEDDIKSEKKAGRRKIKIEYIDDKSRRHITFSKRKAGIMKKAYELSTLTGTQVLLLVVSETGLVYTFTTPKLQPLVTKPEGKNLIQACLNAPDAPSQESAAAQARATQSTPNYGSDNTPTDGNNDNVYDPDRKHQAPNSGQISSAQSYALGLNPYATNQYGNIPSSMAMGTGGLAQSYMSPAQYPQYNQQHLNQYAAAQGSPYMQSPTGYWNQANTGGNGAAKVQQFSPQPADKK
ncbi:SRF-TF-domain-containing protein [Rhizophagus clarus]|uniref:SRF-TF-domain-containing protein n=1 Tax=Rhizophagus clarus TaxID=94130 RepID=A0A8H3LQV8_9GLOM|nr:SRF-TF-domain-containing protein [Rhizophagus clarus]